MNRRTFLSLCVLLLLVYFALRLINLTAFPPFVDESTHIDYGRAVLASGPFARAEEGRQFLIWWYILFAAQTNAPLWIARAVSLIGLLPGLAAIIGTARLLSNRWAAFFAALFLIFSPYHDFFERLALADPISASAVTCAIYFAVRLHKRAALSDAILCGIALFVAFGLKVSAFPYFVIPAFAMLTLRRNREGLRWAVIALLVVLGLTGAFLGILYWRGYNPLFHLETPATGSRLQVVFTNISNTTIMLISYLGAPTALLLMIALVVSLIHRRFFLPLCLLFPLAIFWLNPAEDSRHLIAPMTLLLLIGAVALGDWVARQPRLRLPLLAAAAIWGLALWIPFATTEMTAPANLPLPANDHAEYMLTEGSGFGLSNVIAALSQQHPTRVIGILANCLSLRDLAPFPVECPHLSPTGSDIQTLSTLLTSSRTPGTYAVLEAIPYAPPTSPGTVVQVIDVNRPRLTIYNLAP